MYCLAPSIYAADYMQLGSQITLLEEMGISCLHVDVMDGCFVPNLSFGPDFVRALRAYTRLKLDVHLMVQEPARVIAEFADAGADVITVHYESCREITDLLDAVCCTGARAGIALKPETDLNRISSGVWDRIDVLQLMTVAPGRRGQHFIREMLAKIAMAKQLVQNREKRIAIEVDGDITTANLGNVISAGADIVVVGKGLFSGDLRQNTEQYLNLLTRFERQYEKNEFVMESKKGVSDDTLLSRN